MHPWERFLGQVTCPGQYIGKELNRPRIRPQPQCGRDLRICICFPDKYTIGMSNLGMEIIVKQLSTIPGVRCERCFAPDVDMENALRRRGETLRSIDSGTPVRDFHLIGFSLQTELSFTNVLTMLDLAGIPVRAADRRAAFPLVAAGGPAAANPAVMSRFIDFFVVGEAEPLLGEIVKAIGEHMPMLGDGSEPALRATILHTLATLPGVYVPGMNRQDRILPGVADLTRAFYPMEPTVPNVRTTHQRLNIEISRGCAHRCAYCQAGHTYQPLRCRPREMVLEAVDRGLATTGYDEVALTGFCVTTYPELADLIRQVKRRYLQKRVSVSVPSLRVDDISDELAAELTTPRRAAITIAPEAASEQLRARVGKRFSNRLLFEKLAILYRHGFRKVKLYFMVGLPGETNDDVAAIPTLLRTFKRLLPGMTFGITVSPFVPRPHTPFQFAAMCKPAVLAERLAYLQKHLGRELKKTSLKESVLEALIARGDERVSAIIEDAWKSGARFDAWSEHFQPDRWFSLLKVDPDLLEETVYTERSLESSFPWEMLSFGQNKELLYRVYCTAKTPLPHTNTPYSWSDVQRLPSGDVPPPPVAMPASYAPVMVRFRFSRRGIVRFISHLDQVEIIRRALRASGIPVEYTQGYNPQLRVSFGPPAPVGWESDTEFADVECSRLPDLQSACTTLGSFLPEGITVVRATPAPACAGVLSSQVNMITCEMVLPRPAEPERLNRFLHAQSFPVVQQGKTGERILDARALVRSLSIVSERCIRLTVRMRPGASLRPETIVADVFSYTNDERQEFVVRRTGLHVETLSGVVVDIL